MGQLLIGIAGAIVGSFFGMPQLGFLLGSLVGSVLFPQKGPDGPRLNNLQVTSSTYGSFITIGYGTARVGGNIIWSKKIEEVIGRSGGKFGKGGSKTYTYYWTGAIALCEAKEPIKDVLRVWADTKLIYDKTGASGNVISSSKTSQTKKGSTRTTTIHSPFRLYKGGEDQFPDSLIEADKGDGNVPAHRGMAYIVFDRMPIADYGNRVPNFTFEVVFSGSTTSPQSITNADFLDDQVVTDEQRQYIAVDWARNRFFTISPGSSTNSGFKAFNIDTMAEYDNRAYADVNANGLASTLAGPLSGAADGSIYSLISGGNTSVIGRTDGDSLTIQANFGTSSSDLQNWQPPTPTGFVLSKMFVPMSIPGTPSENDYLFCLSIFGDLGVISVPDMTYVAGSQTNIADYDATAENANVCPGIDPGTAYLISYPGAGDFIGGWSGTLSLHKVSVGGNAKTESISGVFGEGGIGFETVKTFSPSDIDPLWDVFETAPSVPVLDQMDGGMIFGVKGGNSSITVSWNGNPSYLFAVAWDQNKSYAALDGVKIGSTYYVSLVGDNVNNPPATSSEWQVVASPSSPAIIYWRMVKYDFAAGDFAWKTVMPSTSGAPPADAGHAQSRVSTGLYCFANGGLVNYFDTVTGDLTQETGWELTSPPHQQPNNFGVQVFDGGRGVIIAKEASSGVGWIKYTLGRVGPGQASVADIVTDLCGRVGLTPDDLDVTDLVASTVHGYVISGQNSVRDNIAPLSMAFFFDGVESDDKLKFKNRGGTPVITINQDNMLAPNGDGADATVFQETRVQEVELPRRITINYMDKDTSYQQGSQSSKRTSLPVPTMFSAQEMTQNVPLAMSSSEAAQIADKYLYAQWTERVTGQFKLSAKWLAYEPTDIITASTDKASYVVRLTKVDVGADMSMDVTGVTTTSASYTSDKTGGTSDGYPQQTIEDPVALRTFVFDSPLLLDSEGVSSTTGLMHFAAGMYMNSRFPGDSLFKSADGSFYVGAGVVGAASTWGAITAPLGDTAFPFQTDYTNTITVTVHAGADDLESVTYLEMLNGANMAAIINDITGVVEILQFQNATLNDDGSYTLDTLLRGRRGTELFTGDHTAGEVFLLLSSTATAQLSTGADEFNFLRFFKGVAAGADFDSTPTKKVLVKGYSLYPYAPVNQKAEISGSDLDISWERRTRMAGALQDGTGTVPLNEASEKYEIDIIDPDTELVLRTLTSTTDSVTYLDADITTDFGSIPATLTLVVYQISAVVGRGFGKEATIDVTA